METLSTILSDAGVIAGLSTFLVKLTLLLGIALAVQPLLRRQPPALRHLTLLTALLALPVLPTLGLVLPQFHVSFLPEPEAAVRTILVPDARIEVGPSHAVPATAAPIWPVLAAFGWLSGTLLLTARLLYGAIRVRRIVDRSSDLADPRLLHEITVIADDLKLTGAPRCRVSGEIAVPAVAGLSNPIVLLPAHLLSWPVSHLRPILRHELAHIKRRDLLWKHLSSLAVALLWFHPLVWVLRNRLHRESEFACDDFALEGGTVASDYADHLLAVARGALDRPTLAQAGLALLTTTQLEGRIVSILSTRTRGMIASKTTGAAVLFLGLATLFPLTVISGPVEEDMPSVNRRIENREAAGRSTTFAAVSWVPEGLVTSVDSAYFAKGTEDLEGSVIVRTQLDATGSVLEAHASPSSDNPQLDAAAVSLVLKCKFKPGFSSGQPVDIAVNFSSGYGSDDRLSLASAAPLATTAASDDGDVPNPDDFIKVDVMPEMISQTEPVYPEAAKADSVEGTVWVKALVDTTGAIRKALAFKASGDARLDQAALDAAYKNKFKPALAAGKPVAIWVTYKVTFSLDGKAK